MWKDRDFKDLFEDYAHNPPAIVWDQITAKLTGRSTTKSSYFNKAQKITLIAACLSSISLSGLMMQFIESESPSEHPSINYTKVLTVEPKLKSQSKPIYNKIAAINSSNQSKQLIIAKQKTSSSKITVKPEFKAYQKEIIELAKIDQEILALNSAIDKLDDHNTNSSLALKTIKPEPIDEPAVRKPIAALNSQNLILNSSEIELTPFMSKKINHQLPEITEPILSSKPNTNSKKDSFYKFYMQQSFGGNFSQIFYRGSPNSEYFSENASFSGKLGYNIGLQFGYQFSKKWGIESGVSYGQYIQSFEETKNSFTRTGEIYIDQLDFPLLARYTIPLNQKKLPTTLSLKAGLMFSNVVLYQVNFADKINTNSTKSFYSYDVDKRQYNTAQLGYSAGLDLDAFVSKRVSINVSILNSAVSQVVNFPTFRGDRSRPIQLSSSFSIGTKFRF